ncbi:hypothetical protein BU25DRAFT_456553 [Macroventuria anomochaeta]|uniref:Uncharacterized protein n=1 Tax=Macroventuria anomochaeta TaxID=301207 RepID=A0ACB6S7B4_9PLEO|nr:uncharacterized protein BU25DRAFT_456553 [Macroventuria anomochaeta]KAF2630155.1 hypothetical protein BU25DRAFT_456553 [Macroventuria anomochaeta]
MLYVLAERLLDQRTKDLTLAAISYPAEEQNRVLLGCPSVVSVQVIYDGTPDKNSVRQLLVQLYTDYGAGFIFNSNTSDELPKVFLFEWSKDLQRKRKKPWQHEDTAQQLDKTIEDYNNLAQEHNDLIAKHTMIERNVAKTQTDLKKMTEEGNALSGKYTTVINENASIRSQLATTTRHVKLQSDLAVSLRVDLIRAGNKSEKLRNKREEVKENAKRLEDQLAVCDQYVPPNAQAGYRTWLISSAANTATAVIVPYKGRRVV